jgi:small subunit ribosomal protein S13
MSYFEFEPPFKMKTAFNAFYTFGINKYLKKKIVKTCGLNARVYPAIVKKKHLLLEASINSRVMLNTVLRENLKHNILFLQKIQCYKGNRHTLRYPVRGQRTHTNAKTRKKAKK